MSDPGKDAPDKPTAAAMRRRAGRARRRTRLLPRAAVRTRAGDSRVLSRGGGPDGVRGRDGIGSGVRLPDVPRRRAAPCPRPARSAAWRSSRAVPVAGTEEDAELRDMRRRFGIAVALTVPLVAWRWRTWRDGCPAALAGRTAAWVQLAARDAGGAVVRLAVARARRALARDAQPEHVHADRARRRRRVWLQRGRDACCPASCRRRCATAGTRRSTSSPPP